MTKSAFENMTPVYSGGGFDVYYVYQKTTPELRGLAADLWVRNKILPPGVNPQDRAREIVMMIARDGVLVGVNTVSIAQLSDVGIDDPASKNFYFYRMFIEPSARTPMMFVKLAQLAREYLAADYASLNDVAGIAHIQTNKKGGRAGLEKIFSGRGYETHHVTQDGFKLYLKYF